MAYDEALVARLRDVLRGEEDVTEKRMFGGLAFLVDGHLAVSASGRGGLLVRVPPDRTAALLEEPGVAPFEMRGRPMTGWVHVQPAAVEQQDALEHWVHRGVSCARSLEG